MRASFTLSATAYGRASYERFLAEQRRALDEAIIALEAARNIIEILQKEKLDKQADSGIITDDYERGFKAGEQSILNIYEEAQSEVSVCFCLHSQQQKQRYLS